MNDNLYELFRNLAAEFTSRTTVQRTDTVFVPAVIVDACHTTPPPFTAQMVRQQALPINASGRIPVDVNGKSRNAPSAIMTPTVREATFASVTNVSRPSVTCTRIVAAMSTARTAGV